MVKVPPRFPRHILFLADIEEVVCVRQVNQAHSAASSQKLRISSVDVCQCGIVECIDGGAFVCVLGFVFLILTDRAQSDEGARYTNNFPGVVLSKARRMRGLPGMDCRCREGNNDAIYGELADAIADWPWQAREWGDGRRVSATAGASHCLKFSLSVPKSRSTGSPSQGWWAAGRFLLDGRGRWRRGDWRWGNWLGRGWPYRQNRGFVLSHRVAGI